MAADIYLSNLNPNQKWFAKIFAITSEESLIESSTSDEAMIELYNSEADAEAGINRVAYGLFDFGTAVPVTLHNLPEEPEISLFNSIDEWHLKVTFELGDSDMIIEFGPLTDKPDVIDSLLITSEMCEARAKLEIDKSTHLKTSRKLQLATHIQGLECVPTGQGNRRNLVDNMRSLDQQVRVDRIQIHGEKDMLVSTVTVVEFEDLER